MNDPSDKRREPRFAVSHRVRTIWEGRREPIDCPVSDISRSGAFVEIDDPPKLHTQICIGPRGAEARGRVVFVLPLAQAQEMGRRPGVGVHLDNTIDPDAFLLACSEATAETRAQALEKLGLLELGLDDLDVPAAPSHDTLPSAAAPAIVAQGRGTVTADFPPQGEAPGSDQAAALRPAARRARKREADDTPRANSPVVAETFVAEVVLVEGLPGQVVLAQALALDDYTPLVARHGLEGLVLCLRRRPLLLLVAADAPRLSGRLLLADMRRRPELSDVRVVLVDASDAADPPGSIRWRQAPADVARARRLIDDAIGAGGGRATTHGSEDARELAGAVGELGKRLDGAGDHDVGVSALRYAVELAPTASKHTLALARALLGSSDKRLRDEAAAIVERVVRQEQDSAEAYLLRAVIFDQRGKKDEAGGALRRARVLAPADANVGAAVERHKSGLPLLDPRPQTPPKQKGWFASRFGR